MRNILCGIAITLVAVSILSVSACTSTSSSTAETRSTQQNISSKPEEMASATALPITTPTDTRTDPLARLYRDLDSYRPPENYSFEFTETKGPNSLEAHTYRLYFKGDRYKKMLVINDKIQSMYYIYGDKGVSYLLIKSDESPQRFWESTWKYKPEADVNLITMLIQATRHKYKNFKIVGTEYLDGKLCTVYSYDKESFLEKYWIENENVVLRKWEKSNNNILLYGTYIKNYSVGNVTDEMVTLPKDVVVIGAPSSTPSTSTATAKHRAQ